MRIKFKDKIYRLKEIESGVDSLMELVEEPKYKHGDFLMTRKKIAFILDREGKCGEAHHLFCVDMDQQIDSNLQKCGTGEKYCGYLKNAVLADDKAAEAIIKGLKKLGKYWDGNRKRIEDIPVYKDGDFVYEDGRVMIVKSYPNIYHVNSWPIYSDTLNYNGVYAVNFSAPTFRYATAKEKQKLNELLKKDNKRWNAEKKCIEDVPVYKNGDFVVNDLDAILIFKEADDDRISDHAYLPVYGELVIDRVVSCKGIKRHATTEEKQRIIDALAERGKRWNEDKKCIENVTVYKKGDILVKEYTENKKFIFILSRIDKDGLMYCDCYYSTLFNEVEVMYDVQVCNIWNKYLKRAEESEKKLLINELIKIGKQWNDDKKCVEDIPKHKFKAGDKVRIKNGVSSKSQGGVYPYFEDFLDQYIGKVMTVKEYVTTFLGEYITTSEAKRGDHHYGFAEDWLELYVEKQQPKFKAGDKVKIKDGISSKTHRHIYPWFTSPMDAYIGRKLTVKEYTGNGYVIFSEDTYGHMFDEEWLEPYVEELKNGDLVIFWDSDQTEARIGVYNKFYNGLPFPHIDHMGNSFRNAVKFESTEQFKRFIKVK